MAKAATVRETTEGGARRSRLPGFHRLSAEERRRALCREGWLTPDGARLLAERAGIDEAIADTLSENVVGVHGLPLGVGLSFRVNGRDFVAPMAIEEPSVVAAASNAARLVLGAGGFTADADAPVMIAQIHLLDVPDFDRARAALLEARGAILARGNEAIPEMCRRGGGLRDIDPRLLERTASCCTVAVHLLADVRDAMGANALNALAEALAPTIRALAGGRTALRILSNLADRRRVRVRVRLPVALLGHAGFSGEAERDGIAEAARIAALDPYRACTHNKGVMNGVDAVALATGNDWRQVEAGAHAWAARTGAYRPLSEWHAEPDGALAGSLEMPLALGTVGGAARVHPGVRLALAMSGVESAAELSMLAGAAGLACNLAALRALATEGIQRGHMALHARSVAAEAGAQGDEIDRVALALAREEDCRPVRARELLAALRGGCT